MMYQRLSIKRYAPTAFKCVLWKHNTQRLRISTGKLQTDPEEAESSVPSYDCTSDGVKPEKRKPRTSLSRAKSAVFEYCAMNPWDYLITVTVDGSKHDRTDLDSVMRKFAQFIRNKRQTRVRSDSWEDCSYIIVPEMHEEDGAWHLHGLIRGIPDSAISRFPYWLYDKDSKDMDTRRWYWKLWHLDDDGYLNVKDIEDRFGWVTVKPLDGNVMATAGYITKYITKEYVDQSRFNCSLYYNCRGLKRAETVFYGDVCAAAGLDFDTHQSQIDLIFRYANDYIRSGYCSGATIQPNEYGELGLYLWHDDREDCFPERLYQLVSVSRLDENIVANKIYSTSLRAQL